MGVPDDQQPWLAERMDTWPWFRRSTRTRQRQRRRRGDARTVRRHPAPTPASAGPGRSLPSPSARQERSAATICLRTASSSSSPDTPRPLPSSPPACTCPPGRAVPWFSPLNRDPSVFEKPDHFDAVRARTALEVLGRRPLLPRRTPRATPRRSPPRAAVSPSARTPRARRTRVARQRAHSPGCPPQRGLETRLGGRQGPPDFFGADTAPRNCVFDWWTGRQARRSAIRNYPDPTRISTAMPERSRGWSGQSTRSDERRTDELAAIGMVTGAAAISTAPTMTFKGRRDRTGSSSYAAGHRNTWPRSLERSRQIRLTGCWRHMPTPCFR
jgi:hypothetical protein